MNALGGGGEGVVTFAVEFGVCWCAGGAFTGVGKLELLNECGNQTRLDQC